jgi:hypothetical protein
MSDSNNTTFWSVLSSLLFWGFIVVKAWGTSFAAWLWWWLFIPIVPWIGLAVQRMGL